MEKLNSVRDGRLNSNSAHDSAALAGAMTGPRGLLVLLYMTEFDQRKGV
jgi:hypothetical protein